MQTLKCFTAFSLWRILGFSFYWITITILQDRFLLKDEVRNQHECLCFYFTSHACFVLYISLCVFCGTCRSTSLRTSLSLCCSVAPQTIMHVEINNILYVVKTSRTSFVQCAVSAVRWRSSIWRNLTSSRCKRQAATRTAACRRSCTQWWVLSPLFCYTSCWQVRFMYTASSSERLFRF